MPRDESMKGKVCLVTGATSGIGEVAATELARRGARVIVVGRSPERCAATVERIRTATGAVDVESMVADLSSQAEVRRLAEQVRERCDRLNVLLNNAGAMFLDRRESADGIEQTVALNHLSYFLLTDQLLPLLKSSAPRGSSTSRRMPTREVRSISRTSRAGGVTAVGGPTSSQSWRISSSPMSWRGVSRGPASRPTRCTRASSRRDFSTISPGGSVSS